MKKSTSIIRPLIKDIQALQDFLDYRTAQEQIAIDLMSSMQYDRAMEVLSAMDKISIDDFKTGKEDR